MGDRKEPLVPAFGGDGMDGRGVSQTLFGFIYDGNFCEILCEVQGQTDPSESAGFFPNDEVDDSALTLFSLDG